MTSTKSPDPSGYDPAGLLASAAQLSLDPADAEAARAEVQRARAQAETLSLKTVAERVDAWTTLNNGLPPPKGRWRQVASEIGVTPEALYRELARRR